MRLFQLLPVVMLMTWLAPVMPAAARALPNVVVIFADDLGYGDIGINGHPTIRTPNIDQMAAEGMRFTQFYVAAPVCTPSRAGLLTGRLPVRSGLTSDVVGVFFPDSLNGIPARELTIAEALKRRDYATGIIGKWHLGHRPEFLPTRHGFDSYFGIPYSNDMDLAYDGPYRDAFPAPRIEYFNVPVMRDELVVERPADQTTITRRYTEAAVEFIREHRDTPFFLYLAHNLPHVPLFRSPEFAGVSPRGLYGDTVEEIDWSVGQVMGALREAGIAENTLMIFTSDNGPWIWFDEQGGSAGPFYGGKGMTWEGGVRVPAVAWWPGTVAGGRVSTGMASTLDIFPTVMAMADLPLPVDRQLDGQSLLPVLRGETDALAERAFFFYNGATLYGVRRGAWKLHTRTKWAYEADTRYTEHTPPLLFNLETDPGETLDVAAAHPEIVARLLAEIAAHQDAMIAYPDQLAAREPDGESTTRR